MATMTRRQWMAGTGATALTAAGCATWQGASARKPNIIFILADDLGYGDLGCYGQEVIQTPRIDAMAAGGVRFTQCYAGSTVCAPSRSCLMTGQHTGHTFVRGNKRVPLPPETRTIAEVLQGAGYYTGLIGKWGLGNEGTTGTPNKQGFNYFFGYLDQGRAHNYYPAYLWRNDEKVPLDNVQHEEYPQVAVEREDYSHDLMADDSLRFLEDHADEPFFLYAAYTIPHANNERGHFLKESGMEVPDYGPYADQDWPEAQKGHAAMITRLDRDVGRILDKLEQLGIAEDTLVIFTSDNGPHREGGADPDFFDSNGPLRGIKRDLYEGGIRVPGIAWWPGAIEPGRESSHLWAFWDFFATAAELAGAQDAAAAPSDSVSIVPELLGAGEQPEHNRLYWEFHEGGFKQAVRQGRWKAVRLGPDLPVELYDLETDLGETNDLAADEPGIAARLTRLIETSRTPSEHWPAPDAR